MDQQIKQLWVDALRSGDYKQGRLALRTEDDRFCVMGVLCNIHAQHYPKIAATCKVKGEYLEFCEAAPKLVIEWAQLTKGEAYGLVYKNDTNMQTFEQLANYIEEKL